MKRYNTVLTIAGSDSGGGAGIQADIKTISALGCYASSAITAITVQNTLGVKAVEPISTDIIVQQIQAVLEDIGADAIKIGMLHSEQVVKKVSQCLKNYSHIPIVLDPVMVSTSGHNLIEENAIETLKNDLIPMACIITPNIPEAELLLGMGTPLTQDTLAEGAYRLAQQWGVAVLLKSGHLEEEISADVLYDYSSKQVHYYPAHRVNTCNTHGTGCTLSSAIAAMIAKGYPLAEAVKKAKTYIAGAIQQGAQYKIGHGFGPVNHFWQFNLID